MNKFFSLKKSERFDWLHTESICIDYESGGTTYCVFGIDRKNFFLNLKCKILKENTHSYFTVFTEPMYEGKSKVIEVSLCHSKYPKKYF